MRQRLKRLREKCPRVNKIISLTSEHACNVTYWGMITIMLYGYLLQYSVTGNGCSIDK